MRRNLSALVILILSSLLSHTHQQALAGKWKLVNQLDIKLDPSVQVIFSFDMTLGQPNKTIQYQLTVSACYQLSYSYAVRQRDISFAYNYIISIPRKCLPGEITTIRSKIDSVFYFTINGTSLKLFDPTGFAPFVFERVVPPIGSAINGFWQTITVNAKKQFTNVYVNGSHAILCQGQGIALYNISSINKITFTIIRSRGCDSSQLNALDAMDNTVYYRIRDGSILYLYDYRLAAVFAANFQQVVAVDQIITFGRTNANVNSSSLSAVSGANSSATQNFKTTQTPSVAPITANLNNSNITNYSNNTVPASNNTAPGSNNTTVSASKNTVSASNNTTPASNNKAPGSNNTVPPSKNIVSASNTTFPASNNTPPASKNINDLIPPSTDSGKTAQNHIKTSDSPSSKTQSSSNSSSASPALTPDFTSKTPPQKPSTPSKVQTALSTESGGTIAIPQQKTSAITYSPQSYSYNSSLPATTATQLDGKWYFLWSSPQNSNLTKYYLIITSAIKRIILYGGCNVQFSTFQLNSNSISFSNTMGTIKNCAKDNDSQIATPLFKQAQYIIFINSKLVFYDQDFKALLAFTSVVPQ